MTRAEWLALEDDARLQWQEWLRETGSLSVLGRDEEFESERETWARVTLGAIGIDVE